MTSYKKPRSKRSFIQSYLTSLKQSRINLSIMSSNIMTPAQLRGFSNSLFTGGGLVPPSAPAVGVVSGLKRSIVVYYIDGEITPEQTKDLMTVLTLYGRSTSEDIECWQTWVLTWVCIAFPEMANKYRAARATEFVLQPIPDTFLAGVSAAVMGLQSDPSKNQVLPENIGFPPTTALLSYQVYNCGSTQGLYSYFSLIVHLMGKAIVPSTRDMIVNRRPKNLMDKFKCTDAAYILTGGGRISDIGHVQIKIAWDQSTPLRKVTINEFCRLRGSDELTSDIVFTMFRMLEYSQMSNAAFIRDFLDSCDWVLKDMPALIPAYDLYVNSIIAFAAETPERRPFIKLYHGDSSTIFHAKSLQDLTKIAVRWLQVNNDSLSGYTAPGGDKALNAFLRLCAARGIDMDSATMVNAIRAPDDDDSTED